jgi:hypothetical protein
MKNIKIDANFDVSCFSSNFVTFCLSQTLKIFRHDPGLGCAGGARKVTREKFWLRQDLKPSLINNHEKPIKN